MQRLNVSIPPRCPGLDRGNISDSLLILLLVLAVDDNPKSPPRTAATAARTMAA